MAALMIVSAAVSAIGAVKSAQAQAASADYNAKVASQNAQMAQAEGNAAAEAQSRDAQRKMGTMLANAGASGVATGTGSPADVLGESAREATLDNLTIKYNAKVKQLSYLSQASMYNAESDNAIQAGTLNATSAILKGATSYYTGGS